MAGAVAIVSIVAASPLSGESEQAHAATEVSVITCSCEASTKVRVL